MPKKILLIDDEEDLVSILKDRLEAEGFEVVSAFNGEKGIELARSELPDLIILDILMPRMTGHEVWTTLQKEPMLKKIPLLILSAKMQATDKFWGQKMNRDDYLIKPYKEQHLLKRVREKLQK